jgi:2-hydroxychromene-2-carboxylate isomerase
MTEIDFHFDPISPYAWLAFERLPQVLEGLSYSVSYRPLLFAGLLRHWGQKGPAEIEPKRAWTFRHVHWLAHRHGIRLDTPAQHPFNPLALLRLLVACAPAGGTPNRWQCEQVFHHVWHGGADANDPARLQALHERLAPPRDPQSDEVKQALRAATEAAVLQGLFGVPTLVADGRACWGLDGLELLAAGMRGDEFVLGPGWEAAGAARPGVRRRG